MRRAFNFRLSEAGHKWVQGIAERHGVKQADVFRACMSVAVANEKQVVAKVIESKEQP